MNQQNDKNSAASDNVVEVESRVSATARVSRNGHKSGVLWFTGLPGSGKSTLAVELERQLFDAGYNVFVLDGDNMRRGLNADLGFLPEDRTENIRRVGEVAALMAGAGLIIIAAFISPYKSDRDRARAAAGESFREIAVAADLQTCEMRDPKGHYKRARAGEIPDFTGVSAPYEQPDNPDLIVDTQANDIDACVALLLDYVRAEFAVDDA
ncbi:MAG TPA: adenylyl-sulfate kinase [Rhodospirillaceae bacterium]|nr:adenylyl-sulfate kinase [Rhodospirillaceae bacterium]HAA93534.1 adenylyl-sulfate kinase [Rhodospirillaceae bacterium]HAT35049.1 adenylyl-sulfate kinase [Rhodospirillaceae bacterium]|tara:strand:- start:668 stop:1297 length:630 start_codon:yes stop_codon:yes gene_type:complete